ncbi:MAG: hypothetical protein EP335_13640 [Alphaproteobacteria bacterium]|nr:MAG: hypothetical protein EP335_13640 [Alphaproteobacteria bacterium]
MRSEGRVRFLTIGSYTQLAMASVATVALMWGAVTSYAWFTRDLTLEQKNRTISSMSAQYEALSSDFSALELEVERRAQQLEERQKFLEEVIGTPEAAPLTTEQQPRENAPTAPEGNEGRSTSMNVPLGGPSFLEGLLGTGSAQAAVPTNSDRRKNLLARLQQMEERQRQLADRLVDQTNSQMAHIDDVLQPTKINKDDLLRQQDETSASAMGGPYMPETGFEPVFAEEDGSSFARLLDARLRLEMVTNVLNSFPVGKPAESYYLSSRFGRRKDPFKETWARHSGLDLAGWPGTAIYATAPGIVVRAGAFGPYGQMVEIDHGNGFRTRYGHMRKVRVKIGEVVDLGTQVGDMGKTGRATDTHLHYEVWFDGKVRDPMPYLKAANDVRKIQGRHEETSEQ